MLRLQTLGRCRSAVRSFSTTTNWSKFWSNKWIEPEAEEIISRAYAQHQALIDHSTPQRPRVTHEELETLGAPFPSHPSPKIGDKIARNLVHGLTPFTHWFFRDKYNHHAVVLETVAAVPGFVGGMLRHFRSLRRMDRDHGWISTLLEDAENERMHLLCVRQRAPPTRSQHLDASDSTHPNGKVAFGVMYIISPGTAHRFVGYLEEEAVSAYTDYLTALDAGDLPNGPAPSIAIRYWGLSESATIRDVVLHVRADECFHRNMNHYFANLVREKRKDATPEYPPDRFAPTVHRVEFDETNKGA